MAAVRCRRIATRLRRSDRWAIIAYVRALQRASHGTIEDVPQDLRSELH